MLPTVVSDIRAFWIRTASRELVTAALTPHIRTLKGIVLDVGGGREAPHDHAWSPDARRIRVDVSTVHDPDVLGDALRLPFADRTIDGIIMVETLEHLPEPWTALDEVHRVLRPGGQLIGTAPFSFPVHGDPNDYFRFTVDGLRSLLRDFDTVSLTAYGNSWASAWLILSQRSRAMRVANPLLRLAGRRPDDRCPLGHLFIARR